MLGLSLILQTGLVTLTSLDGILGLPLTALFLQGNVLLTHDIKSKLNDVLPGVKLE